MSRQIGVSVVVVSFNTREHLRACLRHIGAHETIVVDNASTDGSAEMVRAEFPDVRLIANAENRGFGAANNQGMDVATRGLVLLLNSDAFADEGAIAELARAFEDPDVVAAGGRLRNPDGSTQQSVAAPLTLWAVLLEQTYLEPIFGALGLGYWRTPTHHAPAQTAEVAQVMGACLMLRPIERFDERFFLYCEDTDLCRRLSRRGKIVYRSSAEFLHLLGSSSAQCRWLSVARYNHGKELYFAIHHGRAASTICLLLDRMGALLRLLVWGLATALSVGAWSAARTRVGLFARVLTAPIGGPARG